LRCFARISLALARIKFGIGRIGTRTGARIPHALDGPLEHHALLNPYLITTTLIMRESAHYGCSVIRPAWSEPGQTSQELVVVR